MVDGSNAYAKANLGAEQVNVRRHGKLNNSLTYRNSRWKEILKNMDEWSVEKVSRNEGRESETLYSCRKDAEEIDGMRKDKDVEISSMITIKTDWNLIGTSYTTLMSIPDSDFHDFDDDKTEKAFGENQMWAAYNDDDDGLP
ncbi:uncharacterized protein LOC112510387 [Cynara cardunculus var. scolymus]|uniref:DUF3444 domain-containing protein n=1 Tax=Cynara cardunculus var. scolymus TaxID=59895 RepID=A0A103YBS0_CYNCS|nr:uncharacterized protein LOC112510387 [Cynara cardunculus var. scolymus]XP_024971554.1 uncharacterized protein LOC112510387 [Cynara cardunculus var. scolymus]KVI06191.1 protein of unknown function DUF3444 [Cynara cardunculus var. scolymus]